MTELALARKHIDDALRSAMAARDALAATPDAPMTPAPMAWGAKVTATFRDRIRWTADELGTDVDYLMAAMAFETGRTFRPDVRNGAGSGATGLIQFMPATARALGTTTDKLAALAAEDQIVWVYRYLRPYAGRLKTLPDVYMSILLPSAIGKPDDHVLFAGSTVAYRQNSGLDANRDGRVTKLEASAKVLAMLAEGRRPENLA